MSIRIFLIVLLVCGPLCASRAQIDLSFSIEHAEFLELEPIPAVVTLINQFPGTFKGDKDYRLRFDITDAAGVQVKPRKQQAPWLPPDLAPGTTATFTNDLSFLYALDRHGPYTVVARLQVGDRQVVSQRVFIDVMPGALLTETEGWTPDGKSRTFSLRQLSRKNISRLFLRVDDRAKSLCYGVLELGRYVPMKTPELKVDQQGVAHVLHMTAPTRFVHTIFSPDGELVAQQFHDGDASAVRLEKDPDTGFRVIGVGVTKPKDPFIDTLPGGKRL